MSTIPLPCGVNAESLPYFLAMTDYDDPNRGMIDRAGLPLYQGNQDPTTEIMFGHDMVVLALATSDTGTTRREIVEGLTIHGVRSEYTFRAGLANAIAEGHVKVLPGGILELQHIA